MNETTAVLSEVRPREPSPGRDPLTGRQGVILPPMRTATIPDRRVLPLRLPHPTSPPPNTSVSLSMHAEPPATSSPELLRT